MAGLNLVQLIGNLGADPELSYTAGGAAVCKMRLATTKKFKGTDGEQKTKTEWHSLTAWRKLAEVCAQWLHKGSQIYVSGELQNDQWEKDGVKRYSYSIQVREMVMLGGGKGNAGEGGGEEWPDPNDPKNFPGPAGGVPEDDIPF
jgi:single-strand DNA-binding protein